MARIQRKAHDSSVVLYNHQKEAMCALNKADIGGEFSGIIVLPTGGGKTITASYWLTKNKSYGVRKSYSKINKRPQAWWKTTPAGGMLISGS